MFLKHPPVFHCRGCLSRGLLLDSRARGQKLVDRHDCEASRKLVLKIELSEEYARRRREIIGIGRANLRRISRIISS